MRALLCRSLRPVVRLHVGGLDHVPDGAAVLVANHPCALDGHLMQAALPRPFAAFTDHSNFGFALGRWYLRHSHAFPVGTDAHNVESFLTAAELLNTCARCAIGSLMQQIDQTVDVGELGQLSLPRPQSHCCAAGSWSSARSRPESPAGLTPAVGGVAWTETRRRPLAQTLVAAREEPERVRVRFWGTRGSLARPGASTLRYGGNTSCVEVRAADGTLAILDCGTGIYGLGQLLNAGSGGVPLRGHIFITHTHWDHIQGFPFFAPLFGGENEWDIYAPAALGKSLEATLAGQMEYTYFPVTLAQLGARIRFHDLEEGAFQAGPFRVATRYLNHPGLTLGYRLELGGASVVYAVDHEPHALRDASGAALASPSGGGEMRRASLLLHQEDQRHAEFLAGADLAIHDAQYTSEEYPKKVGWGHSPAEWAVDCAAAAGVRQLALYHHDPLRHDEALDELVAQCQARARGWDQPGTPSLDVFAAAEGQLIDLPEQAVGALPEPSVSTVRIGSSTGVTAGEAPVILIADDDPDIVQLLELTLEPDQFRIVTAQDGEEALALIRQKRPSLVLLDWNMPALNGLQVCRAVRADSDPQVHNVPVVMITARTTDADLAEGFAAGATDYLTKPFAASYIRTRVRTWMLRAARADA